MRRYTVQTDNFPAIVAWNAGYSFMMVAVIALVPVFILASTVLWPLLLAGVASLFVLGAAISIFALIEARKSYIESSETLGSQSKGAKVWIPGVLIIFVASLGLAGICWVAMAALLPGVIAAALPWVLPLAIGLIFLGVVAAYLQQADIFFTFGGRLNLSYAVLLLMAIFIVATVVFLAFPALLAASTVAIMAVSVAAILGCAGMSMLMRSRLGANSEEMEGEAFWEMRMLHAVLFKAEPEMFVERQISVGGDSVLATEEFEAEQKGAGEEKCTFASIGRVRKPLFGIISTQQTNRSLGERCRLASAVEDFHKFLKNSEKTPQTTRSTPIHETLDKMLVEDNPLAARQRKVAATYERIRGILPGLEKHTQILCFSREAKEAKEAKIDNSNDITSYKGSLFEYPLAEHDDHEHSYSDDYDPLDGDKGIEFGTASSDSCDSGHFRSTEYECFLYPDSESSETLELGDGQKPPISTAGYRS